MNITVLDAMDSVIATPPLGYVEQDALEHMCDQTLGYAAGKPINVVNPEVLKVKPA